MTKKEYDPLVSFLTAFDVIKPRKHKELALKLKSEVLDYLVQRKILHKEFQTSPQMCPDGSMVVKILTPEQDPLERGYYILKCQSGKEYSLKKEEYENEYTIYSVNYKMLMRAILERLEIPIKEEPTEHTGFFEVSDTSLGVILLTSPPKTMRSYFRILSRYLKQKKPVVILGPDSSLGAFLEIVEVLPLGDLVYFIPFSLIQDSIIKSDLAYWLEMTDKVRDLEKRILEEINSKRLRKLMVSIESNPRYLLSLLSTFKVLKLKNLPKNDEYFENISALAFRYLYGVDMTFGGSKDRFIKVPDSIVYIRGPRDSAVKVIGIVDAKSSLQMDFSREITEKYGVYIRSVLRILPIISATEKLNIAFIFVVLGVDSHSILDFHGRLMDYVKTHFEDNINAYTVLVPLEALELLILIRLSIILREAELSEEGLDKFFADLFTEDCLIRLKEEYQNRYLNAVRRLTGREHVDQFVNFNHLHVLPPELILHEIEGLAMQNSSFKSVLQEIRKIAKRTPYYFSDISFQS